jgi:tetratricopeptide (TPR) repeat protein
LSDTARRVLAQRPTASLDAYTLYLRGRYYWNTRSRDGLAKAVTYFERAIERDSAYALAYAGLADVYLNLADYRFLPGAAAIGKAKAMAQRALALDETLAQAHVSLGGVLESEREWQGAEAEYRRGIVLDPSYPTVHQWYALLLTKLGRETEALREIRRAQALDPLSLPINNDVGVVLEETGDSAAAIAEFRRTLTLEPEYPWTLSALGMAYATAGRHEDAIQVLRKALYLVPGDGEVLANLGYAYARAGRRKEARATIDRLKSGEEGKPHPFYVGLVYAALGERDSAFHWLDRAHPEARSIFLSEDDPQLTTLRSDPRFPRLMRRFGVGAREVQ